MSNYSFAERRKWFEEYTHSARQGTFPPPYGAANPMAGIRWVCPCCGYPTLEERSRWEICCLCRWGDYGQDDPHADEVWGGPNYIFSLSMARSNFEEYLTKHDPRQERTLLFGIIDTTVEQEAKRHIVAAFDSMVNETDQGLLNILWQRVSYNEKVLELELFRRAGE